MEEIWRDIEGYENLYQISNYGRVKSLERIDYHNHHIKEKILKSRTNNNDYALVNLYKNGKMKTFTVHRILAQTFLPNPNNYPQVNHKQEGDKTNNFVYINEDGTVNLEKSNLEFCTAAYNNNFGTRTERAAEANKGKKYSEATKQKMSAAKKGKFNTKKSKSVLQIDPVTNEVIAEFPSIREVERNLGFHHSAISKCCLGKHKSCSGFRWKFK